MIYLMKNVRVIMPLFYVIFIISCDKETFDPKQQYVNLGLSPSANAEMGCSYLNWNPAADFRVDKCCFPDAAATNIDNGVLSQLHGDLRDAVAYMDMNNDGLTDIFMATGKFLSEEEVSCFVILKDPSDPNGSPEGWSYNSEPFDGNLPPATHARKTIKADFNGDGLMDILVLDHGFDSDPFPGNNPKLILQDSAGHFSWQRLTQRTGFHHCGASADIDHDGDQDVFVGGSDQFFLINDGNANFQVATDRFDERITTTYTAEMRDVDQDGFVDLLVAGSEGESLPGYIENEEPRILWGNSMGAYTLDESTLLPPVAGYGTTVDFDMEDIDNDGDIDLILNRTGGSDNFYQGIRVQLLTNEGNRMFIDASSNIDNPGTASDDWVTWLRVQDIDGDGDLDIFSDNLDGPASIDLLNDGNGNFTRQ